jgi:hypothetical protein
MEIVLNTQNRQPNNITMSKQNFDALEKKILYLVINQLDTGLNIQQSIFDKDITVSIPIRYLNNTNYNLIKTAAETIQKKQIRFVDDPQKKEFTTITPFPVISVKNSILHVTIYSKTIQYFIDLKKGYTSYQLKNALALNSKFSQRFYEMISRFKDTGHWGPIKIDLLKELLTIEDKYSDTNMLKKRVLDVAKEEILAKTELGFNYELIKKGRKYTHISFTIFTQRKSTNTESHIETNQKDSSCLIELKKLGITNTDITNKIICDFQSEFWSWLHQYKTGQFEHVKNPSGYLLTTLGLK